MISVLNIITFNSYLKLFEESCKQVNFDKDLYERTV